MALTGTNIEAARRHLRKADEVMREIIHRVGPVRLRLERNRFAMLVRSIISQQISTSAARSIHRRLKELLSPGAITPADIVTLRTRLQQLEELEFVFKTLRERGHLLHNPAQRLLTQGRQQVLDHRQKLWSR